MKNDMESSINELAERAYHTAIRRGKVKQGKIEHNDTVSSLGEEYLELILANESIQSEHLPSVSQVVEELTDIAIGCMTELFCRGVDVEKMLKMKIEYNEKRK